jgi:hypothetical protein
LKRKIEEEKPVFITSSFVQEVLSSMKANVEIKEIEEKVELLTVDLYFEKVREYFNYYKNVLMRRLNPLRIVSIASIKREGEYSVIGMVREVREGVKAYTAEVEDETSSIKVLIDKALCRSLYVDDVIGVEGRYERSVLKANKVVFPWVEPGKRRGDVSLVAKVESDGIKVIVNGSFGVVKKYGVVRCGDLNVVVVNEEVSAEEILARRKLKIGVVSLSFIIDFPVSAIVVRGRGNREGEINGVKVIEVESEVKSFI